MQVLQQDGKYVISLFDSEQNPLDRISESLTFTLPAESETATVLASYEGGSDNWGGQFDAINQTIEFSTPYSGTYEVIENAAEIVDLADCDEQTAAAIRFMVSKGYFSVDDADAIADWAARTGMGRLLPDPQSVGKGQGEQRPDPVGRGVPAPIISQTEQEDGSLIVSVSDEDMARIERLRAYCSLDIFTDTECTQPDNSLLTGSRLLDSLNAAHLYHLDQSDTFTVNI